MSDQVVQLQPDGSGKKIDVSELTVGGQTVQRQRINLSSATDPDAHAEIKAASMLDGSEKGLVAHIGLIRDMAESLKNGVRILTSNFGVICDQTLNRVRVEASIAASQTIATVSAVTSVNQINAQNAQQTLLTDQALQTWAAQVRSRIS